jgi:hypothetical protein
MQYQEWRSQIKPEKKVRNYQHIDDPLNLGDEKTFQKVITVIENLKNHQFLPFIKKIETQTRFRRNKEGKTVRLLKLRPIMYASHIDSHIYSYYNFLLSNKYEEHLIKLGLSDNVIAYRKIKIEETEKGKSNVHFAKDVFDYIRTQDDSVVITQDIEHFFDTINHNLLKQKISIINGVEKLEDIFYKVFRSLTSFKYIEYSDFVEKKIKRKTRYNKYAVYKILKDFVHNNKTGKGIPQGSPISGLLANIFLIEFDTQIKLHFPSIFYRRYSDDLVFVCKQNQKDELLNFINKIIHESLLEINPGKSFISFFKRSSNGEILCESVTDGLNKKMGRDYVDYLGLEFTGKDILMRKNTIQKLKFKQTQKKRRQLSNTESPRRRKQKRNYTKVNRSGSSYFKRTVEIINEYKIKKQVLKVVKDRNKIKSK